MSDRFGQAEQARRAAQAILYGTIDSVDLPAGTAVVLFEPDWRSAPLPWIELSAGRLRTWSPPIKGEQVLVLSPSGEPAAGAILRGLTSDAFPHVGDSANLTRLEWADGATDDYDVATHTRLIGLPEGGRLLVNIGATVIEADDAHIKLKVGSAELVIVDGEITLKAATVNLGDTGGKPVARHGDAVAGGAVVATTTKVKAA